MADRIERFWLFGFLDSSFRWNDGMIHFPGFQARLSGFQLSLE